PPSASLTLSLHDALPIFLGAVIAVAVLVFGGTYVYIHFIEGDAPERLTFSSTSTTAAASTDPLAGTWRPTSSSRVGYRVKKVLRSEEHTSELQSRFDLVC